MVPRRCLLVDGDSGSDVDDDVVIDAGENTVMIDLTIAVFISHCR